MAAKVLRVLFGGVMVGMAIKKVARVMDIRQLLECPVWFICRHPTSCGSSRSFLHIHSCSLRSAN